MDALEAILTRRSIRKFTHEIIKDTELSLLLRTGFAAPSAHNKQPWEFVVIKDDKLLNDFAKHHPYAKMLPEAGCGIVVCGNSEIQNDIGYLVADCAAAIENILLAAHALNLGAVWCGLYPTLERIRVSKEILNLPNTIIPVAVIAVGHKVETKQPRENYDEKKVHYNRW